MLLLLLLIPIIGIIAISSAKLTDKYAQIIALYTSIINLSLSVIIYMMFDFTTNQYQFVEEYYSIKSFDLHLGIDGLSVYFMLLTTIIIPISLVSN